MKITIMILPTLCCIWKLMLGTWWTRSSGEIEPSRNNFILETIYSMEQRALWFVFFVSFVVVVVFACVNVLFLFVFVYLCKCLSVRVLDLRTWIVHTIAMKLRKFVVRSLTKIFTETMKAWRSFPCHSRNLCFDPISPKLYMLRRFLCSYVFRLDKKFPLIITRRCLRCQIKCVTQSECMFFLL